MIQRLLVANRGEIASRVFATCRRLGIETVAVHSDADADLPYVRRGRRRGPPPGQRARRHLPRHRPDPRRREARRRRRDPPGLRLPVRERRLRPGGDGAGLHLGRPDPESIEQMGSKVEAKGLMEAAGVPVLPNLAPDDATEDDLPLLVKASAGGGGRGMRIVHRPPSWPEQSRPRGPRRRPPSATAPSSWSRTSSAAATSRCRWSATGVGDVLVLGERDCSIQRRHQKVVEESPAPRPRGRRGGRDARGGARRRRGDRVRRRRHRGVPLRRRARSGSSSWR